MSKLGRKIILLLCTGLIAGCAGIPVAKNAKVQKAAYPLCNASKVKYPSELTHSIPVGVFSDAGGDPRIPEADLSVSVPNFAGSLDFVRIYDSMDMDAGAFGRSWFHSFESRVTLRQAAQVFVSSAGLAGAEVGVPQLAAELRTPQGQRLIYKRQADGSFLGPVEQTATFTLLGSTTNPDGFTWAQLDKTVYAYNAAGKLTGITDRNNGQVTLAYTGGTLTAVRDPSNRTLYSFAYNGDGRLAAVTDLGGRSVSFAYQGGMLASVTNPKGANGYAYTSYTVPGLQEFGGGLFNGLDSVTLLTQVTSPNGQVTSFTYGPAAQVVDYAQLALNPGVSVLPLKAGALTPALNKAYYAPLAGGAVDAQAFAVWFFPQRFLTLSESGPLGTFTFSHKIDELLGEGTTGVTDPKGYKRTHTWATSSGRTLGAQVTDAAGGVTSTEYDVRNNPVKVTDRVGRVTQFVYDSQNNVTSVIDPLSNRTNFTYEPNFNGLASVTDPKGNSSRFTYDAQGNLTQAADAQNHAVQIGYDPHGLPVSITDPLNHTVTIARDGNGYATSITDPLNRTAHMGYDNIGRVVSFADGASKTTQFAYDTDDNLTQVTDAINGVTHYNYTAGLIGEGKLLSSLQDAKNQTTQFAYDSRGRLISVTNPLNQTRAYEYDEANNLTKVTKADGIVITFEYDNLNRLTRKNIPGDPVTYAYDAAGNLITAEDNASKIQTGYDAGDRPTKVIQTNKAANLTSQLDYEYDQNGNRTKMTLAANPSPFVWNYTYDTLNRLINIRTPENTAITFEYDAMSRRTRLVYPNGTEANYTYDNASQLTGITHKKTFDNTIIAEANYAYDNAGNRTSMTDTNGLHSYGYDNLHRLTSANHPTASALDIKNEVFSYDQVGNRTADAVRTNYAYDAANRLAEDSLYTYTYDQNGNRNGQTEKANSAHTTYAYNAENKLTGAIMPDGTVAIYKYDTSGHRIEKSVNGTVTRYIYDGEDIVATVDGSNNLISRITHGPGIDDPLSLKTGTTNYYYHADGLGSITSLTDDTGAIAETMEYLAYGKPIFKNTQGTITDNSPIGNIYSYTAREYDVETGFFDNRARHRSPDTGGFIQEDPIGFAGEDTNLYVYVRNNSINYSDPYGLVQWGDAGRAAGGIVGNGFGIAGGVMTGGALGWTGVGAVISGAVVVKSAYGFGANMVLMKDALLDKKPSVKGALLNELAYLLDPCDEDLQALATAGELGLDLLALQVPKFSRAPGYFIGPDGLIGLQGGGRIGEIFMASGLIKGLTVTQAADAYDQVRQARKQ